MKIIRNLVIFCSACMLLLLFQNCSKAMEPAEVISTLQSSSISSLSLSSSNIYLYTGQSYTFSASGGSPPYAYSLVSGSGSMTNDGYYQAANWASNDVIVVTDAKGAIAYASVSSQSASTTASTANTIVNTPMTIHRAYNYSNGDYYYSAGYAAATNYTYQGPVFNFYAISSGTCPSGTNPVFQCTANERFFLSTNSACEGYTAHSVLGCVVVANVPCDSVAPSGYSAIYRFINPNNNAHLVTQFKSEGVGAGFSCEHILGYTPY